MAMFSGNDSFQRDVRPEHCTIGFEKLKMRYPKVDVGYSMKEVENRVSA